MRFRTIDLLLITALKKLGEIRLTPKDLEDFPGNLDSYDIVEMRDFDTNEVVYKLEPTTPVAPAVNEIVRVAVKSSNIKSVGWLNDVMHVEFHDARLYEYTGVPHALYTAALAAQSIGTYLNTHLFAKFESKRIK